MNSQRVGVCVNLGYAMYALLLVYIIDNGALLAILVGVDGHSLAVIRLLA